MTSEENPDADRIGERAGWSAVCVVLLTLAVSQDAPADVLLVAAALWGLYRCWVSPEPSLRLQVLLLGAISAAVAIETSGQLNASYQSTDSIAFGEYSAELVLRGVNPFTHSLASSLLLYHVPLYYTTHYLSGATIVTSSYPAGSFIFYLPALALGSSHYTAVVIDIVFWVVSMVLLWALLPKRIKWIAALFLASSVYLNFILIGVTDSLYLPFVILALWRWDRYGDPTESGISRWIGPVAFGVAMSVKQTPWILLPFLLIGVAFEASAQGRSWLKRSTGYLALCASAFAAVNAPWILANPGAWFNGSVTPLFASFVPIGHGLIDLTLISGLGGGDLRLYTLAGAAWIVMSILLLGLRYRRAKSIWVFAAIMSFFLAPRSLGNYFLLLLPGAIIAAVTVRQAAHDGPLAEMPLLRKLSSPVLWLSLLAVLVFVAGAEAKPAPLEIAVTAVSTNGEQGLITEASVRVHNNTARILHPKFTANSNGSITNFWQRAGAGQGPVTIGPNRTETIMLRPPDVASMPPSQSQLRLVAYTANPPAISSSRGYESDGQALQILPSPLRDIHVGESVTVAAQLVDSRGGAVHRAGVGVDLSEQMYTKSGQSRAAVSIVGQPQGTSPASAITNSEGLAIFMVTGVNTDAASDTDYLQASITTPYLDLPPSGYSSAVAVRVSP